MAVPLLNQAPLNFHLSPVWGKQDLEVLGVRFFRRKTDMGWSNEGTCGGAGAAEGRAGERRRRSGKKMGERKRMRTREERRTTRSTYDSGPLLKAHV